MKEEPDEILIEKIKEGELQHFAVIMRRYNQRLYRIGRGMNVTDADCDDMIQQAYLNAFEKMDQFHGDAKFSTWLTRIFINLCLMEKRKNKTRKMEDISGHPLVEKRMDWGYNADDILMRKEMRKVLEEAVAALPAEYRTVYLMRETEEMSVKETADCLALSESNVKVRLHRAKALMKNHIEKHLKPADIYEFGNARCDAIVNRVMQMLLETANS